ncbi:hypothetical protein [Streptomyces sp. 3N207]|uniref:hypothetical protein n=1 Tax=Streptomyces sp. 3N207 TaxID=3457417 RepID=UPI003FD12213
MTALLEDPAAVRTPRTLLPAAYTTELRRGIGPAIGVLIAVTLTFLMFLDVSDWQGTWIHTTDQLRRTGPLLCGPISVAGGCWLGGRERRRRTGELRASMPRGPLRQTLLACAPAALWPAAGYLLAAAVCLLTTLPDAQFGHPNLSLTAADATAMAALGTLGFAAGRVIPWRLAGVALAAVTYAALGMTAYGEDSPLRWLSPANEHYGIWDRPTWWAGPLQMLWTGSVAATALLLSTAHRRVRAAVPLAATVVAGTLLVQASADVWRPNSSIAAPVCTGDAPKVCVSRLHSRLLPEISAQVDAVHTKLKGVQRVPKRFAESPLDDDFKAPPTGTAILPETIIPPDRLRIDNARTYRGWVAHSVATPACRESVSWPDVSAGVVEWLAGVPDPTIVYHGDRPAAIDRTRRALERMSAPERTAWLTDYFAAVADCDPGQVRKP